MIVKNLLIIPFVKLDIITDFLKKITECHIFQDLTIAQAGSFSSGAAKLNLCIRYVAVVSCPLSSVFWFYFASTSSCKCLSKIFNGQDCSYCKPAYYDRHTLKFDSFVNISIFCSDFLS